MIKKIHPIFVFVFCSFHLFLFNSLSFALTPAGNPYVKVKGSQLIVGSTGQPYIVQGVGYEPIPIGRYASDAGYNAEDANPTLTNTNPSNLPSNIYDDPTILNRDFSLLQTMGANTIRIWKGDSTKEVSPGGSVTNMTFENAFPLQPPGYGDSVFNLLVANNIVDATSGAVSANLTSLLPPLGPDFPDPGEYNTILDVLELALNGEKQPGLFPNAITPTTLSTAGNYGLKVIAGFYVGPFGPSNTGCPHNLNIYNPDSNDPGLDVCFDITNPYIANDILLRFEEYVNTFKNDPNILFWAIGNENNLSFDVNPSDPYSILQIKAWYSLVNQMANAAHLIEDPTGGNNYHPVAVVNGDEGNTGPNGDLQFIGNPTYGTDDQTLSSVDIWGTNIYRGQSFNDYFVQYKKLSSKPLWISEYGIDAWQGCDTADYLVSGCDPNDPYGSTPALLNQPANDESDQATWDGDLWNEIAGNGDIAIGGTIMEYSDEWWKPYDWICTFIPPYNGNVNAIPPGYAIPPGSPSYCHLNHLYFGEGPNSTWQSFSANTPDHYLNEDWFGLMGISNASPEIQADTLTPRKAYYALQAEFGSNAALPSYLASPVPGSMLNSPSVTFVWSLGRGVTQYQLLVGTTPGGDDIYSNSPGTTATSAVVPGIPASGQPVYVQLGSQINGSWQYNNYIYNPPANAIIASAGIGGTISPLGTVNVNNGANQSFNVIPNADYGISQVLLDGSPISPASNNTYTIPDVTAPHTISANFTQLPQVTLDISAGNGSVTPSVGGIASSGPPYTYNAGTVVTLTATPDSGYQFISWSGDVTGTSNPILVTMNTNKSVAAGFVAQTETITASAGAGGTISPSGAVSVNYGASQLFTVTPNTGFNINQVLVDGTAVTLTSGNTYTIADVTTSHTIAASFTSIHVPPTVSITSPVNDAFFTVSREKGSVNITIRAKAGDSDGTISKVVFYNGLTLLGTATSRPYIFKWDNVLPGSYALTAVATDNTGAMATSSAIAITVTGLPVVSLTADDISSAAPATINLMAVASEANGSISKVEFYNGLTLLDTVTTGPYNFIWSNAAAGKYSLRAVAYDANNHKARSTKVVVIVNGLPVVSLAATVNKATRTAAASVNLTATASEAEGTISKVDFYNGTTLLGTDTTRPYKFKWTNVAAGTYHLTAVATDSKNNTTTSNVIAVTVSG